MKRFLVLFSVTVLGFCGLLALAEERPTAPRIENIRLGVDAAGKTRVVFDLDSDPQFAVVPVDAGAPTLRVTIDGASLALATSALPKGRGIVGSVAPNGISVDLRLSSPALPVTSFVIPPSAQTPHFRLVIDIAAATERGFQVAAKEAEARMAAVEVPAETAPTPEPRAPEKLAEALTLPAEIIAEAEATVPPPSLKPKSSQAAAVAALRSAITVVLDPGHGGYDPGAIGSTGLQEKDVTLAMARKLEGELIARGYKVILTRDSDAFVKLGDRILFARDRQADLFMSLHADANEDPLARGATVYTLTDSRSDAMSDQASRSGNFKVFDLDVGKDDSIGRDVGSILFDLANTDTKNESVRLAASLIAEMRGRVPMVNNTHRRMSLQVLLSPDVPAVLVELAFLSNKKDEANLASEAWRDRAMIAVADGIDHYFSHDERRRAAAGAPVSAGVNP